MGLDARLVLAAWLAVTGAAVDKKFNITVGYLPSLTGEMRNRQGLTISGALTIALEEINNSTEILPDVKILLEWHDTKSYSVTASQLVTDMSSSGVVAFFGPEGRCYNEAVIAESKNLPMISYKCSDHHTSTLSNFVKLEPSGEQAIKSVVSLLRYYRWNKFSIIHEESWTSLALVLEDHAKENNMTINHRKLLIDVYWYNIINNTKYNNRIYVFLGTSPELVNMMNAMETLQLFAKGEYMVIFVDMMIYVPRRALSYLRNVQEICESWCPDAPELKKRAQSLLVVVSSEPFCNYQNFMKKVREYNKAEPFKFPELKFGGILINKHISVYAAYLYDSVKVYAAALNDLIKEDTQKEELSNTKLMSIAKTARGSLQK